MYSLRCVNEHVTSTRTDRERSETDVLLPLLCQDYQLYRDLRHLEDAAGKERWLTSPEDDDKWEQYARENGFVPKLSAGNSLSFCVPS